MVISHAGGARRRKGPVRVGGAWGVDREYYEEGARIDSLAFEFKVLKGGEDRPL